MKFVHSIQGASALHVAVDEVVPESGLISRDLIKMVGDAYNFGVRPEIPSGILPALLLPYIFQDGAATIDDRRYPIFQLIVLEQGDIVNSSNTDLSDKILADYMTRLDTELGYRFARSQNKRVTHQSHVVVDFDVDIGLGKMEAVLNGALRTPGAPFNLKRLAFGSGPATPQGAQITLRAFERMDFLIERRTGENPVKNRYYSAAPTTTSEHLRLLEAIEREFAG